MPGEAPPTTSEDCLYLNVWAPAQARNLPVIVWIYGGGFFNGSASMPLYWGDQLARQGAIVITFGYRVGPFGFLAHPELTTESPYHSSGNYGLLDQIAALKWVGSNIAAFGGDPGRVTIAGQSAGAASVSILMVSPLAKGLFRRAIAESGGMFEPMQIAPGYQLANAERDGEAYARSVGATSLAELRALPALALLTGRAGEISHPVVEPHLLPRSPYDVFAAGEQNDAPILIGSNADEARSLITDLATVRAATFETDIAKRWGALPPSCWRPTRTRRTPMPFGRAWISNGTCVSAGICGPGRGWRPSMAGMRSISTPLSTARRFRRVRFMPIGGPATMRSSGTASITWIRSLGPGPQPTACWPGIWRDIGSISRAMGTRTGKVSPFGHFSLAALSKPCISTIRFTPVPSPI